MDSASIRAHRTGRGRGPGKYSAHGLAQCRAKSGPQHAYHRAYGRRQFFDRGRQRFPPRYSRSKFPRLPAATADSAWRPKAISRSIKISTRPKAERNWAFQRMMKNNLPAVTAIALRVKPGDDASCLNLYRPRQPRLLGVPQQFIDRGGFAWADMPGDCPESCRKNGTVPLSTIPGPATTRPRPRPRRRAHRAGDLGKKHGQLFS